MDLSLALGLLTLIFILFILHQINKYFCGSFNIFRAQGIPGPRPIPIFGTWWGSWKLNPHELALQHYKKYGKIYCTFRGRTPVLHIHDLDLLRPILVKDSFEYFGQRNRRPVTGENEYVNKTMSMLVGDQWKELRNLAMASFSPQVVKQRMDFVDESLKEFVKDWKRIARHDGKMDLRVETEILCEELMMNYTAGVKLGTLGNPNHPFVLNARKTMEAGERSFVKTFTQLYPKLLQWFFPVMDTGNEYFVTLAKQILKERSEPVLQSNQSVHHVTLEPDLIDRLAACLSGDDVKGHQYITEVIAIAQITSTILTGYDLGTVLTRVLHCLTVHPEVQARCRQEIQDGLLSNVNEASFSLLTRLNFLEQCIREALRLYPTTLVTCRICTKSKQYSNVHIPKGACIECPVFMVQRDPNVYPDPLKYDPDRFGPDTAQDRNPFNFLAFGQGPRGCFAQKFSMNVLKHCLLHLLSTFEFFPVPETKDPICFATGPNTMLTARDMWVGIKLLPQQSIQPQHQQPTSSSSCSS